MKKDIPYSPELAKELAEDLAKDTDLNSSFKTVIESMCKQKTDAEKDMK